MRVLIVEDHADSAEMLAVFLRAEGHDVEVAEDAGAALTLARRIRPTVVLLDIDLPIVDGIELARILRAELGSVRLFVVSAYSSEDFEDRALALGIERYFTKPAPLHELAAALAKPG